MSDINLKRFVDIDLKRNVSSTISSIRDTVALFTDEGTANTTLVVSSKEDYDNNKSKIGITTNNTMLEKYVKEYFNEGGIKLHIYAKSITDFTGATLKTFIGENVPTNELVIGLSINDASHTTLEVAKDLATSLKDAYGINQKIIVTSTKKDTDLSSLTESDKNLPNLAIKYSSIGGAEMSIAAYLSKMKIYGTDTVQDYAFTEENITPEKNNDTLLGTILDANANVDMNLANATRNLGGNLINGTDLVNQYMSIVLQQTVTDRLISLLTQKIKGNTGISAIYTTIAAELSKYVTNGYLTTDRTYKADNKYCTDSLGRQYTLIEQNTPLNLGYQIVVLPYSSLTDDEIKAHKCPYIYIFLAESYGIREITIEGEII